MYTRARDNTHRQFRIKIAWVIGRDFPPGTVENKTRKERGKYGKDKKRLTMISSKTSRGRSVD